jgi:hypothetical protein
MMADVSGDGIGTIGCDVVVEGRKGPRRRQGVMQLQRNRRRRHNMELRVSVLGAGWHWLLGFWCRGFSKVEGVGGFRGRFGMTAE